MRQWDLGCDDGNLGRDDGDIEGGVRLRRDDWLVQWVGVILLLSIAASFCGLRLCCVAFLVRLAGRQFV